MANIMYQVDKLYCNKDIISVATYSIIETFKNTTMFIQFNKIYSKPYVAGNNWKEINPIL